MATGLLRNSLFNLLGGIVPAIASLLTVPVIVSRLGDVQYGIFALVTTLVGYFAILDINATAGSIKYLAEHRAQRENQKVSEVVCFGGAVYLIIGVLGLVGLWFAADTLIRNFFQVPAEFHEEGVLALRWAAFGFLFGQVQVYFASIPQALQRYDVSGKIESVFGTLVSLSTVIAVLSGGGLVEVMAARVILSVINNAVLFRSIRTLIPSLRLTLPSKQTASDMLHFSAYGYLSRFATISYINADKLFIGALQDMRALSMYTVPFMLANRVMGLFFRLVHVVFPFTSAMAAKGNMRDLERVYVDATRYYTFLNASIAATLMLFSRELLHYWAGPVFGADAALVLCIVGLAVFADSLTNLPSLVNDGLGKPQNTGILAFLRAVVGLTLGYLAIREFGASGAAFSLLITATVMTSTFLAYIHRTTLKFRFRAVAVAYIPAFSLMLPAAIAAIAFHQREVFRLGEFGVSLLAWFMVLLSIAWFVIIDREHRTYCINRAAQAFKRFSKSPS